MCMCQFLLYNIIWKYTFVALYNNYYNIASHDGSHKSTGRPHLKDEQRTIIYFWLALNIILLDTRLYVHSTIYMRTIYTHTSRTYIILTGSLRECANFRSRRTHCMWTAPAARIPVVPTRQIKIILLRMQTPSPHIQ